MTAHVDIERTRFVELRRRILEIHPDLDDQTLADTLEGATNLKEAIVAVIRSAIDDEALVSALKERLDASRQRLARLEARALGKRQSALLAMDQSEMQKLIEPDFTASIRQAPPRVEILDEAQLPFAFLIPQPPKVDKRAVLVALTNGMPVAGAMLAASKLSLTVRTI